MFKIFLPYGNRVVLRLEIGDPTVSSTLVTQNSLHTQSTEISTMRPCSGLMVELWDGSSSWIHCSRSGEAVRNFELESRENRVIMKVLVRGTDHNIRMRFRYHSSPIPEIVQQCSFGWVAVRQFCVTVVENVRMSWQQAELECHKRGGHLASVRSEQAQIIIDNLLLNRSVFTLLYFSCSKYFTLLKIEFRLIMYCWLLILGCYGCYLTTLTLPGPVTTDET